LNRVAPRVRRGWSTEFALQQDGVSVTTERLWTNACAEHDEAVAACVGAIGQVPGSAWQTRHAAGKWSPAEEALHVVLAYEFGVDAATRGASMRLLVPPFAAWLSGHLLLPLLLRARRFPRGAAAPREVQPSIAAAQVLSSSDVAHRLTVVAEVAARALREADARRPSARIVHAYFGALSPHRTLRLLSAHTRHHAASLRAADTGWASPDVGSAP